MSEHCLGTRTYQAYGPWLRARHDGRRVHKVIVDAGLGCPNRDGSKGRGGCAYCNVDSFTPAAPRAIEEIRGQVEHGIAHARKHYGAEKFILYFQPNTNTHAPVDHLRKLYDSALEVCPQDVVALAVGTRPDCLDEEKIALLESYAGQLDVHLELGMESIYDATLQRINRCCTHGELTSVLERLRVTPLHLCLHVVLGFPWESRADMLAYADEINRFTQVGFIKLHHLHLVEGSILAAQFQRQPFELFSLEGYTDLLCELLPRLRPDLVIERLFGVADPALLIAPKWGLAKSSVQAHLEREFLRRGVRQGAQWCG